MRLSKAWIIAARDFKIFRRLRNIWYSLVIFPVVVSVVFPLVLEYAKRRTGGIPAVALPPLLNAFSFFLVIGAAALPLGIASYTIVGEKVEKSLEPLLATPLTDGEILLGKTISAVLPTLVSLFVGGAVFMVGTDAVTYGRLGYYYFPNWTFAVLLLVLVPIAIVLSVEYGIIISSRVNDARSASSSGIFILIPFGGMYVAGEVGLISLDTNTLLIISGILLAIDVALFFVSTATFRREEILTKWK